ncbi:MAG: hypothetical protein ACXVHO_06060 [Methanobacterium sp.]
MNKETPSWENAVKPCLLLMFCPYGNLTEEFPISDDKKTCEILEHDCPVFYLASHIVEGDGEKKVTQEEFDKFFKEIEAKHSQ